MFGIAGTVTADQMQAGYRHIDFVATGIFEQQQFMLLAINLHIGQALIAADTMVNMHNRCAGRQFAERTERIFRGTGIRGFAAPTLQDALAVKL